jgi:pimeloyl-ACP methyl ester carboxylesterase
MTTTATKTNLAPVNGIELYYEIHGEGQPLILLHGGVGAIEMFGDVLPTLAQSRQVIGVDLQAHGRTADIDRPMSFESMADDIAALIRYLGISKADVMGYSLGGGVAIQTAIRHPDIVRKLVAVSAPHKKSAWYPEVQAGMAQMSSAAAEPMKQSPMYALYSQIAPRVQDWPVLLDKTGDLLRQDYDYTEAVKTIQAPTMIVIGDADSVMPHAAVEFFELLGGGQKDAGWDGSDMSKSRLAILPGITHYTIFSSPKLAETVIPFLDAPMPAGR